MKSIRKVAGDVYCPSQAEPPPITYHSGGAGVGSLSLGGMGAPLQYPPQTPPDLTPHMQPAIEEAAKEKEKVEEEKKAAEEEEGDEENDKEIPSGDPNSTLYVRNLKEGIKKQEMLLKLRQLFSQCGKIRKVNIRKGFAFKGQVSWSGGGGGGEKRVTSLE